MNLDNLSQNAMDDRCRGVACHPILMSEPKQRALDASHADINLAVFLRKSS